jgi:hypothetical protein
MKGCHGAALTELERKQWLDHEWALCDRDIQSRYAGSVVAIANRTVLGVGTTHLAALQAAQAQPDCPPRDQIVTVVVEGSPVLGGHVPENEEQL